MPGLTHDQLTVIIILLALLAGFTMTRLRHDVVAICGLLACVLTGLTGSEDAFSGFSHPAVITVALVLMISAGMKRAGVITLIADRIEPYTENVIAHVAVLVGTVAVASAFMNNVGALALMLPEAVATAQSRGRPPAMFLMPLAFGSLLGGMGTLIGTPPNIIIASFRPAAEGPPFAMFDFTPVGASVAAAGLVYLILVGWRLVPHREADSTSDEPLFTPDSFIVELVVPDESDLAGKPYARLRQVLAPQAELLGVVRKTEAFGLSTAAWHRAGDILLARAEPDALGRLIEDGGVNLSGDAGRHSPGEYDWSGTQLGEILVPSDSIVARWTVDRLNDFLGENGAVVALAHQGRRIYGRLGGVRLAAGDVLLVQGPAGVLDNLADRFGLVALVKRDRALGAPNRLIASTSIFAAAIVAVALGVVSAPVGFSCAVLALLAIGTLRQRSLYESVDWPLIVLLGALFPVGRALDEHGVSVLIAEIVRNAGGELPVWIVIALLIGFTMLLSDVINNAATALVMAPIAVRLSDSLALSADPFLMAVAIGASSAFLTPIGHQSNTLVYSRGGYRFGDYWRVGLPLDVVIVMRATPMILWIWPV